MSRGGEGGQGVHGRSPGSRRKGAEQGVRSGHPAESTRDPSQTASGPGGPAPAGGLGWAARGLLWSHRARGCGGAGGSGGVTGRGRHSSWSGLITGLEAHTLSRAQI